MSENWLGETGAPGVTRGVPVGAGDGDRLADRVGARLDAVEGPSAGAPIGLRPNRGDRSRCNAHGEASWPLSRADRSTG